MVFSWTNFKEYKIKLKDNSVTRVSRTPLQKKVGLDEINNAIDYLIRNKSVTGEILTLDSGQSFGWQTLNHQRFLPLIKEFKLST